MELVCFEGNPTLVCYVIVIEITFYSSSCLGQETAKGPFRLRVKLPPAHLSTTHGGGFILSLLMLNVKWESCEYQFLLSLVWACVYTVLVRERNKYVFLGDSWFLEQLSNVSNPNQIFYYSRCIVPKRVTSLQGPSPHHCARATQLLWKKYCSCGEPYPIWPAWDLNFRLLAPETKASPLDQLVDYC